MGKPYVIVIGRQFGSGGREIGIKLGEKLGIPVYDKELLATIAQEQGISPQRLYSMDENLKGNQLVNMGLQAANYRLHDPGFLFETDTSAVISRNQVYEWQSELIKKLAKEGSCIFIGRCADYVLRGNPGLISLFIKAPLAKRQERVARIYPDHPRDFDETYVEFIQKTDKARASYYNFHTDREWGSINHYHLCLDSTKLGIEGTADFLAEYVNRIVR